MATSAIDGLRVIRHPKRIDGVTLLTGYLVALIAIPSRLVIGPLGGAGSPATVIGLGCLVWWIWFHIQRAESTGDGFQPVRCAFIAASFAFLASFVAAMMRPISGEEFSGAHLGIVLLAGWGGALLLANDGIPSSERLIVLIRRIVAAGGAMATLGMAQFITGEALVDVISIPGLSENHALFGTAVREGFVRPAGTATHPIEYGAVLTMILPLALAIAISDRGRSLIRRWYPVLALVLAVPLSNSRSTLLSAVIGGTVLAVSWPPVGRRIAAAAAALLGLFVYMTVPGMIGGLIGLFTNIGTDTSALSRTGSYSIAQDFIEKAPFFGRGFYTFLPKYRILDNQYLSLMIEVGLVGVASVLILILASFASARRAHKMSVDPCVRQIAQGLAAAVAAGSASLALFDGWSFPMSAGLFFLMVGLAGGVLRLVRQISVKDQKTLI